MAWASVEATCIGTGQFPAGACAGAPLRVTGLEPATLRLACTANTFCTKRMPVVRAAKAVIRYCPRNHATDTNMRVESTPVPSCAAKWQAADNPSSVGGLLLRVVCEKP